MGKLSNKTPTFAPPPTPFDINKGMVPVADFYIDAWTTEDAVIATLKHELEYRTMQGKPAYYLKNANCCMDGYVFSSAIITMSERASYTHKWASNRVVREITMRMCKSSDTEVSLAEYIRAHFEADNVMIATPNMYLGSNESMTVKVQDVLTPTLFITFKNDAYVTNRNIPDNLLSVITPKSGAIILNGVVVQPWEGMDAIGRVPVPCAAMDGTWLLPEVYLFNIPVTLSILAQGNELIEMKAIPHCARIQLEEWRKQYLGVNMESEIGLPKYVLNTSHYYETHITFTSEGMIYTFGKTERA